MNTSTKIALVLAAAFAALGAVAPTPWVEPSQAQTDAGVLGAPYAVTPRRLKNWSGGGGGGGVTSLAGTANQVSVSGATGAVTLSTPQDIATTSSPQFSNVRITHSTLTYGANTTVSFTGDGFRTVTLTGNITFASSNLAAGRSVTVRIVGDGSERVLAFPGDWTFVGAAAPSALAANKVAILTLTSFGTGDSDVLAAYSAEP